MHPGAFPAYLLVTICAVIAGCASTTATQREQRLANKTVVVTGASSGFGRALYHRAQMVEPPTAPLTSGILHEGAASGGANVSGGNVVRIAAEESSQEGEK
jgi:hypothetical protein